VAGADQTVLNDTNVIITMNTIVNTDATTFDTSVPSKIKLKKAGLYALTAQTQWSVYTAFFRSVWIADATTGFLSAEGGAADDFNDYPQASGTYIFPVNDVIELIVHQSSGLSTTIFGGAAGYPDGNWLQAVYLGATL